ncbi:MAG: DUF3105 domain-containing protein [Chloroflexi bacterium]|nr:DUF3105 domain-containing protein [Chloroflexota bacterium]
MRPAPDRRGPSRRTTARQERRQRSQAKRARKRRFFMAGGLIIALALITGLALPSFGVTPTPVEPETRDVAGTQLAIQEGDLLEPGETAEYDTSPPTSGPSWAEAAAWGVHEEQVADEAVVRNLRNGAVVFNYQLASGSQRAELQAFVESLPGYPDCYVLQPHAGVGEGEIELTAWGWRDVVTPSETDAMRDFVDDHRANGPDAEIRGESCGSGSGA